MVRYLWSPNVLTHFLCAPGTVRFYLLFLIFDLIPTLQVIRAREMVGTRTIMPKYQHNPQSLKLWTEISRGPLSISSILFAVSILAYTVFVL
jgi:hypothetical protein